MMPDAFVQQESDDPKPPPAYRGPGLVDLQVNGYAGFDFNGPADAWTFEDFLGVKRAMGRRGVVVVLPTFVTDDAARMIARARRYAEFVDQDPELESAFPKLHIEGPFISPIDGPRGAHPAEHCRSPADEPDLVRRIQEASRGRVGILTLAPELQGALELIADAVRDGITVAIGHTDAPAEIIRAAVDAGASMSTHLGNGSHQMLPRLDNYVQVQLADDRLFASFIADGHHVPWSTLKNFLRAKTRERSVLITDAISAADVGPGRYRLGEKEVVVSPDLRVQKPGEANLSGSALTLDHAVLNVATYCDVSFPEAWAMASSRPASLIGIDPPPEVSVRISSDGFAIER